jgi:hypothetical protein
MEPVLSQELKPIAVDYASFVMDIHTRTTHHGSRKEIYQQFINGARILSMVKKTDGTTELTQALVLLAQKFPKKDYNLITSVMFALKMGVNYGYKAEFDPAMMADAKYIFKLHSNTQKTAKIFKLKLVKGSKDANVKL